MTVRLTHRARQRSARRIREPRLRFGPLETVPVGDYHRTMNYSCPTCRYEMRVAHSHKPIEHPDA